jgi:hypothetical protein
MKKRASEKYGKTALYLMFDFATCAVKIGYSLNPKTRARTLLSDRHSIRLMFHAFLPSSEAAKSTEFDLHHKFRHFRLDGEWFALSRAAVDAIIESFTCPQFNAELDQDIYSQFSSMVEEGMPDFTARKLEKVPCLIDLQKRLEIEKENIRNEERAKYTESIEFYQKMAESARTTAANYDRIIENQKGTYDLYCESIVKYTKGLKETKEERTGYKKAKADIESEKAKILTRCERLERENKAMKSYIENYTPPTNITEAPFGKIIQWVNTLRLTTALAN